MTYVNTLAVEIEKALRSGIDSLQEANKHTSTAFDETQILLSSTAKNLIKNGHTNVSFLYKLRMRKKYGILNTYSKKKKATIKDYKHNNICNIYFN